MLKGHFPCTPWPLKVRHFVRSRYSQSLTQWHGTMSQKTWIFNNVIVWISVLLRVCITLYAVASWSDHQDFAWGIDEFQAAVTDDWSFGMFGSYMQSLWTGWHKGSIWKWNDSRDALVKRFCEEWFEWSAEIKLCETCKYHVFLLGLSESANEHILMWVVAFWVMTLVDSN